MTVNTNGNTVPFIRTAEQRIAAIETMVQETRDSQLRTEAMVNNFIEAMGKNPMFKMMAGKFGG